MGGLYEALKGEPWASLLPTALLRVHVAPRSNLRLSPCEWPREGIFLLLTFYQMRQWARPCDTLQEKRCEFMALGLNTVKAHKMMLLRKRWYLYQSFFSRHWFHKIVTTVLVKETVSKVKRQWEKLIASETTDKGLISKIRRQLHTSQNGHHWSLQTVNAGEGVEKRKRSCTVGGNVNWYGHYGRWYGDSLKKLETKPPYDPAIPLLGIYPEETKMEKDTCNPLFVAAQ